jgi:hypothetical protein
VRYSTPPCVCATIARQKATSDYILRDYSGQLEAPEGVQSRYISKMGGGDVATRGLPSVAIALVDLRSTAEATSILLMAPPLILAVRLTRTVVLRRP